MSDRENLLSQKAIENLISSMTQDGHAVLTEIQAERFLNALTRYQTGLPTGLNPSVDDPNR